MRFIIPIMLLLLLSGSCERYPDPSYESVMNYQYYFGNGSYRKLFAGNPFPDTIQFITYNYTPSSSDSLRIVFRPVRGGGSVSATSVFTDSNGIARTKWQLGTESLEQVLRASVYLPDGTYLSSAELNAYGFREDEWDKISSQPDGQISWVAADTINRVTFMVTNGVLYRQGERYFDWNQVTDNDVVSPRTLMIDGKMVFYITTWNGELLKSADRGESWTECTKPYPEDPYFIYMHISNDDRLWVFKFDHPTKYSDDGGETWNIAGEEMAKHGFGWVYRLSNGWLFFHGSDCCNLFRSEDDGETWIKVPTPGYSYEVYANEKDELYILSQGNGYSIYRSVDMGASFNKVVTVWPDFGTTMEQSIFHRWGSGYFIIIPGYGILKSDNLINYITYYENHSLNNLFIDHNGVVIAKDWDYRSVYYRKNSEK